MARTIAVLGASNTGKSTLVDRMCALEGQPHPAAAPASSASRASPISARPGRRSTPPAPSSCCTSPPTRSSPPTPPSSASAPTRPRPLLASPYLHAAEAAGTPALIFINRIDEATARVRDIVAALQDYAHHPIVLRQIPIREGGQITGAVDLVSERAWAYREGEPSQLIEIPAGTLDREHEARGELLEHLSEFDDHLLEELIEDREPAERRGLRHLRQGPRARTAPSRR